MEKRIMLKLKRRVLNVLYRITNPRCWILVGKVDNQWSDYIDDLIDRNGVITVHHSLGGEIYTATTDTNHDIWVANYPYSFGNKYSFLNDNNNKKLPGCYTGRRLADYIRSTCNVRQDFPKK